MYAINLTNSANKPSSVKTTNSYSLVIGRVLKLVSGDCTDSLYSLGMVA